MSDSDLQALERKLRTLPPLLNVPPTLVGRSLTVDGEQPTPPATARRAHRRPSVGRVLAACGVVALLALATLTLRGQTRYHRIASLTGAGNASGSVAVGPSGGSTEPVVISIAHLRPAPAGSYYEISFQTQGKPVPGAVFNVAANGSAVVRLNAPADTRWVRCWVTRRSRADSTAGHVVMTGASTLPS